MSRAGRFRYSLASLFGWITLVALLLAGVRAFPSMRGPNFASYDDLYRWAALLNEIIYLTLSSTLVRVVGRRSRYDFALGFVVFGLLHCLFCMFRPRSDWPLLMHVAITEFWVNSLAHASMQSGGFFAQHGWLGLHELRIAAQTLLAGVIGGLYTMWRAKRLVREAKKGSPTLVNGPQ